MSFNIEAMYRQVSNIRHTLAGNKIDDHSDVVGASPVGAAPNYIFIVDLTPGFIGLGKDNCTKRRETFKFGDLVHLILEILRYLLWQRTGQGIVNLSPPDKMAAISQGDIFECIFVNEKYCNSIQISLKFVLKDSIDYKSALDQVMGWRRTGAKPLPEPMLIQFTDA